MSYPKKVRLHTAPTRSNPRGTITVESFAKFCVANGGLTREEGKALLEDWVRVGATKRRSDGGFDVIKVMPRKAVAG